jgi:hypothetical protein
VHVRWTRISAVAATCRKPYLFQVQATSLQQCHTSHKSYAINPKMSLHHAQTDQRTIQNSLKLWFDPPHSLTTGSEFQLTMDAERVEEVGLVRAAAKRDERPRQRHAPPAPCQEVLLPGRHLPPLTRAIPGRSAPPRRGQEPALREPGR